MAKVENDLDIFYAVGNINTQRRENEIAAINKKGILFMEIDFKKHGNRRY